MKKLTVDFEHCYGIKKLQAEFDFEKGRVHAIYAPNGVMKTSFANAFHDLSQGTESTDRIWKNRETKRTVKDENGNDLPSESVFVIEPYKPGYRSDRIATLMVNEKLRTQYEEIHKEIDEKVEIFVAGLKPLTGLKAGIKEQFSIAITFDENDFFRALGRVKGEVEQEPDTPLGDVVYSQIFNPKVEAVLNDPNFTAKIREYIEKYDELVSKSTFFKKGVFTHNNAADIAKNLNTNGFFKANHSIYLRINGQKREVSSLKELEAAIQEEKARILTDADLQTAFEEVDKTLTKNADLRGFRQCLEDNPIILTELNNPDKLKQKLWVAYLVRIKDAYMKLLCASDNGREKISKIVDEAKRERTRWAEVIHIFNERFAVPFVVRMNNQEDVILKSDAPSLCFDFLDDPESKNSLTTQLEEKTLIDVLSNGEKRALYILNIIFEVEARKSLQQNTLFIVDDIADSFDYKNKYAIVEYLKDMGLERDFRLIILSHNFDFFRTVAGRLAIARENLFTAIKDQEEISLKNQFYKNPFIYWKKHLHADSFMLIASIPFLRNLAEYSGDTSSYAQLTSLLHIKPGTEKITVANLESLVKKILHDQNPLTLDNPDAGVKHLIYQSADSIAADNSEHSA
ncbi:MAG: hypothetical protein WC047_05340, partial [Kiritimatiellales bacterium]